MSTFKDLTVSGNIACEGMITKGTDNFTVRIYNEQKRAIEASTWAALIVPII